MKRPPSLKPGDAIRIVAPARKVSLEDLQFALQQIESWGLRAIFSEELFASENQFAGADSIRAADFQSALDDPNANAILCAKGGYGSVRIIDQLDFSNFIKRPKWIIGYSDITVFHSSLNNLGIASLHASMPLDFKRNTEDSFLSLRSAIAGQGYTISSPNHPFNKTGEITAPILGGNLSMLYSMLGSDSSIDLSGKILFLEDLDEYLYHVDRMMYNLARNNYLKKAAGIIVGGMSSMNDNSIPFGSTAEEILAQHFEALNIPIAFGIPAGHLSDNQALIFGLETELRITSQETIIRFPDDPSTKARSVG